MTPRQSRVHVVDGRADCDPYGAPPKREPRAAEPPRARLLECEPIGGGRAAPEFLGVVGAPNRPEPSIRGRHLDRGEGHNARSIVAGATSECRRCCPQDARRRRGHGLPSAAWTHKHCRILGGKSRACDATIRQRTDRS